MPQPWYRQFQKPKPANQGAKASSGAAMAKAEGEALRKRYSYYAPGPSESTKRDVRLRKFFARYLGPGNIMGQGPVAAFTGASQGITNLAVSANEAFKEAVIPGYQSPATKQAKALQARYKAAGGTGFWKPRTTGYVPMPGSEQYTRPTEANPYMANPYAYRAYLDYLRRVYMTPTNETTAAPAAPEYAGEGGTGGFGYPYYGWGGGGGVNINFGGGKSQQQIARLPTTPSPDIQGWLQSLINWNIGG
jgi:hypothetical protein